MNEPQHQYALILNGQKLNLSEGEVTIGRSNACVVKLNDESVSRTHALLTISGGRAFLRDLNSSNGSYVSGRRVSTEVELKDGEVMHVGETDLTIRIISMLPPSDPTMMLPKQCTACGARMSEGTENCPQCGISQIPPDEVACPNCMAIVKAGARFCNHCGATLEEAEGEIYVTGYIPPEFSQQATSNNPKLKKGTRPTAKPGRGEPEIRRPEIRRIDEGGGRAARDVGDLPLRPEHEDHAAAVNRAREEARVARRTGPAPARAYEVAGFGPRLAAYLLDMLILSLIDAVILLPVVVIGFLKSVNQTGDDSRPDTAFLVILAVCVLMAVFVNLYYVIGGWAKKGYTLGKRILGLSVVTAEGESPIGWKRAILRFAGYIASGAVLYIGFLMIAFDRERRGLHDMIAGTRVIFRRDEE